MRGFTPRSALELDDSSQVRIEKILNLIGDCKFAVHDLSRTEADATTHLPRFNMPLELGIFLGAKRFGEEKQKQKNALILDREKHRYQGFISDIAGQDIKSHNNDPDEAIKNVRNWLSTSSGRKSIPGGAAICTRYAAFRLALPDICARLHLDLCVLHMYWRDYFVRSGSMAETDR